MIKSRFLKRGSILRDCLDRYIVGNRHYQWLFEKLYLFSIAGLNHGVGATVDSSGEKFVMEWFRAQCTKERPVVFDVGANKGDYSRAIHQALSGNCLVYAFEPSKAAFQLLTESVTGLNVRAVNLGVSNQRDSLPLYTDRVGSGLASLYPRQSEVALNFEETITLTTVDEFCQRNGIDHIDLMKIDVEGHELRVVEGASGMLAEKAVDVIQFEFGGCNIDSRTYFRDLWQLLAPQFRIYRILRNGLRPMDSYSAVQEIFVTANFLAVRLGLR